MWHRYSWTRRDVVTRMRGLITRMRGLITRMRGLITRIGGLITRIGGLITRMRGLHIWLNHRQQAHEPTRDQHHVTFCAISYTLCNNMSEESVSSAWPKTCTTLRNNAFTDSLFKHADNSPSTRTRTALRARLQLYMPTCVRVCVRALEYAFVAAGVYRQIGAFAVRMRWLPM